MKETAPKIDPRSAQDVSRQLRKLLAGYAPQLSAQGGSAGLCAALAGVFSRYAEVVIQRLNQTPEKNLLAYLDMLGLSVLPPQPARAPLTFFLTAGSMTNAVVPAGTQVAAKPAEGDAGPVVFETERELTVVAARLTAALTRDPSRDAYAERSAVIYAPSEAGAEIFRADSQIEHIFYIKHEQFLAHPALRELHVNFQLAQVKNPAKLQLSWEVWDGARWLAFPVNPAGATPEPKYFYNDVTAGLTKSGEVKFIRPPVGPPTAVGGFEGHWLRCRLTMPLTPDVLKPNGVDAQLPSVGGVTLQAILRRVLDNTGDGRLAVEAAFLNFAPTDTSKSFLPFGEKPRVGDALYLAQSEAFSLAGATVTLDIDLTRPATNPATGKAFDPPVVKHAWEFWDGAKWATLFTSEVKADGGASVTSSGGAVVPEGGTPSDKTQAFTKGGVGKVTFTFPSQPARTVVNGVENFWVRVRIVSGDYGREAYYKLKDGAKEGTPDQYVLVPASFAPPTFNSLAVGYTAEPTAPPDAIVTYNDFAYKRFGGAETFRPFVTADALPVALYLGFTLPDARLPFPNRVVSLYVGVDNKLQGRTPDAEAPAAPPRLSWQYWDGLAWSKLAVFDATSDLTREGMLEFLAPPDFAPRAEFGLECYWVRVVWTSGQYQFNPRVRSLLINTVMASQAVTVRGENLGSSAASADQKFTTTAAPVLPGQRLMVREPDRPSLEERKALESEEGPDAIEETLDESERPVEIWVRWHEVPDFYGSGARDRHYVVNHLTGEVTFGDGLNGMIPPRGAGNLRLESYRTGGGRVGNRAAGTITELKTTVPYVDSVSNAEPAAGGADAEDRDSLIRRGPSTIRHRDRAVTVEDYEDIAMMASPGVVRVKCVPLEDMAVKQQMKGVVSVIVVPDSTDAMPYPDLELLDAVRAHLESRRAADGRLVVVGPEYVRVTVSAEVVPGSEEAAGLLAENVSAALARFLHPLTGGADGEGWSFGAKPHASDIYAVIESVEGVGYVRSLQLSGPSRPGGEESPENFLKLSDGLEFFLVYSGAHKISLVFD